VAARPGDRVMTVADTTRAQQVRQQPVAQSGRPDQNRVRLCGRPPDLTSMILDVKLLFPSK